jgi:DNA-directed RNA polymerase specialized sigma24 family protein
VVLQETLLAAWRGLERFEGRASLRAWLYRIATNRCLNMLRDRGRRPPHGPHSVRVRREVAPGTATCAGPPPLDLGVHQADQLLDAACAKILVRRPGCFPCRIG